MVVPEKSPQFCPPPWSAVFSSTVFSLVPPNPKLLPVYLLFVCQLQLVAEPTANEIQIAELRQKLKEELEKK